MELRRAIGLILLTSTYIKEIYLARGGIRWSWWLVRVERELMT